MSHRWNEPTYPDPNTTFRTCKNCPVVKITRHEPANFPPHWTEWQVPGKPQYASQKVPPCEPVEST